MFQRGNGVRLVLVWDKQLPQFQPDGHLGYFTNSTVGEGPVTEDHGRCGILHHLLNNSQVLEEPQVSSTVQIRNTLHDCGTLRAPMHVETVVKHLCKVALGLLLMAVAGRLPAGAVEHPVKLDKDSDCASCHQDKTQAKVVHPAIAMGCNSCHVVRSLRDRTSITLKKARVASLCFQCHADKDPGTSKGGKVHPPAASNCLACHDPHVSEREKLLVKETSGGKDENLCLSCHTQGLKVPAKGSRHAALDMGCATCHTTHKVGDPAQAEFKFHLTKQIPALCIDCHDPKDSKLATAHQNQPFATANCITCHDPHQSASPKLMQAYLHSPFEAKTCEVCHQPAQNGKVVLTQADSSAVCATCHSEQKEAIEKAKVSHPGAAGECTTCHNPHGGMYPRFIKPDPVSVCESCHSEQAEQHKTKKILHGPVFNGSCSICHAPHGGDRPKLLRADTNQLCLTCHNAATQPEKIEGTDDLTMFGGKVRVNAKVLNGAARLRLVAGRGHPAAGHPVGGPNSLDPKSTEPISCLTCHTAHAGDAKNMLVTGTTHGVKLCNQCHVSDPNRRIEQ